MIGRRTLMSLAQFLEPFGEDFCATLLRKHDFDVSLDKRRLLADLADVLEAAGQEVVMPVVEEIVRTEIALKTRVTPKYLFSGRFDDLVRCLLLDGYVVSDNQILPLDPSIADAPPVDDDLVLELKASGLPRASDVVRKITASSDAFRSTPPDYNASLTNARVALETLAADIATDRPAPGRAVPDLSKWGAVITHLRMAGIITQEQERGLTGVYGFVSPGAHRPIGISEEQMTWLGRSLAMSMSWFLLKRHRGGP